MKTRSLLLVLLSLLLAAMPAAAQGGITHTIAFDGFSFSLDSALAANINVVPYPGDPLDLEQPGGPEPAHTRFLLYNAFPAPENQWDALGGVRVYRTADIADYEFSAAQLTQLQALLAQRPDLAPYMTTSAAGAGNTALPALPVVNAAQVIRAQARYVDLPGLSGIRYLSTYGQAPMPITSGAILYQFEGLSADGQSYVSVQFTLQTPLFPAEIPADFDFEAFMAGFIDYLAQSVATLNAAAPGDFTPTLDQLDALVASMTFAG
jgi:hypothetical protein